jgi:hypothetical protein
MRTQKERRQQMGAEFSLSVIDEQMGTHPLVACNVFVFFRKRGLFCTQKCRFSLENEQKAARY